MDAVRISVFSSRVAAICDEMGAVLRRTAFSPNIRDRLDFSCALFDTDGRLVAQAAHIPVHLGSMAYAMADVVGSLEPSPGDILAFNDPFLGGTHLPDVTLVAPVFIDGECVAWVANRAHHADIGAVTPGSMPLSTHIDDEGVRIPPQWLRRHGADQHERIERIVAATRNPEQARGDFAAQRSSAVRGVERLGALIAAHGRTDWDRAVHSLNAYASRRVRAAFEALPDGDATFTDALDDDGQGHVDCRIRVRVRKAGPRVDVDFDGTDAQVAGNVNCPLPVTAAATWYVFRCLLPPEVPACAGAFEPVSLSAPIGSLVHAQAPAAVVAGNVETSQRIVDTVCGALAQWMPERVPAASQGTMNNLAMGAAPGASTPAWDYYETLGGGAGGAPDHPGRDAVHVHMTNTLNTPVEALEMAYPLRIEAYAVRRGSGGAGRHPGGDGVIRRYCTLDAVDATLLTERRTRGPWGLSGGESGQPGENRHNGRLLAGKVRVALSPGDVLEIRTPGGGGWGAAC